MKMEDTLLASFVLLSPLFIVSLVTGFAKTPHKKSLTIQISEKYSYYYHAEKTTTAETPKGLLTPATLTI